MPVLKVPLLNSLCFTSSPVGLSVNQKLSQSIIFGIFGKFHKDIRICSFSLKTEYVIFLIKKVWTYLRQSSKHFIEW